MSNKEVLHVGITVLLPSPKSVREIQAGEVQMRRLVALKKASRRRHILTEGFFNKGKISLGVFGKVLSINEVNLADLGEVIRQ